MRGLVSGTQWAEWPVSGLYALTILLTLSTCSSTAGAQFPANIKVVTAGYEGLVGHNSKGIVNIGFTECGMRR